MDSIAISHLTSKPGRHSPALASLELRPTRRQGCKKRWTLMRPRPTNLTSVAGHESCSPLSPRQSMGRAPLRRFWPTVLCLLFAVIVGGGVNVTMGWLDSPAALIGILISAGIYPLALLIGHDVARWRSGDARGRRRRHK